MTLHPDVLTDLVILYHSGEASEASRVLLEAEAARNPRIASALAAPPRAAAPLAVLPVDAERIALREINRLFRLRHYLIASIAALLLLALASSRLSNTYPWLPIAIIAVWWAVAFSAVGVQKKLKNRL